MQTQINDVPLEEFAKRLGRHPEVIRRQIKANVFPRGVYYRMGRRFFFDLDRFQEWKSNGGQAGA